MLHSPPTRVDLEKRKRAFQGYFAIDRYHLRHEQFGGGMAPPVSREIFERGHAVCVLPYDAVRDEVVLIEQFRPGPFAADDPAPWLIETVAGIIEAGEDAQTVARREAVEESGLTLGRLVPLSTQYMSPGGSSETIQLFIGECDCTQAGGLHGLAEEGEDIRVFTLPFAEGLAMAQDGRIRNAMTTIALMQANCHRQALRKDWAASK